MNVFEV